ncbi:ribokinase [Planctomycetota bacterium]|nr:ribokinase [Planctomycetota bacterium]
MSKILVIGSINMDVVTSTNKLAEPGQTILVDDVQLVPGGKGANAAVAAAKLSADVHFIGAVGDDAFGNDLRNSLERNNINCQYLQTLQCGSGTAIITVNKLTAQNSIMVGQGANAKMQLPQSDKPFAWADILMLQLETPLAINIEAAKRAKANNTLVILDPAPAYEKLPDELYQYCDIISPNETELSLLTGHMTTTIEETTIAAKKLLTLGAKTVIAKMSSNGALLVTEAEATHFPAYKINPVDTTAAGDAFTGCLANELAKHNNAHQAIQTAMGAGALTCTKFGAQTSLPTEQELVAFLASQ